MLIDSSIVIDHLRGHPEARQFLQDCQRHGDLTSHAVVVAEVLAGARNRADQDQIERVFASFRITQISEVDSTESIRLLTRHRLASGVGWLDCLIAATALRLAEPVATLNVRHFSVFSGLQVLRPY